LIEDEEERRERCLTELVGAFSNETMKWIANCDFSDADRNNPVAIIQALGDHIKESTNPTVTVVELFTMKRQPHEGVCWGRGDVTFGEPPNNNVYTT
jgi:hypothetical protein